jgi:BON domain
MADYRGQPDETSRRHESDSSDSDLHARYRQEHSTAHNPEDWGEQHLSPDGRLTTSRGPRERGGYWRQYETARDEMARSQYVGLGPKGYKRSDDRIREEICDRMTEDPMLDASEIEVDVIEGEVTLSGSVMSRDQKRRAADVAERISGVRDVTNQLRITRNGTGHNWATDSRRAAGPGNTSSQPVSEASGKGTPSKTTSGTSA